MKATTTTTTEQANTCVIYTRVSTEEQTHGTSLESQLTDCLRIAAARGLTVLESIEDAGLSGTIDERPGLMRAQSLIASGKASVLVVYRLDRLARRLRGVIAIAEGLDRHKGWILTADGNEYGNTFTGRFFLQMLGAMAEMEHRQIVERCQRGREARARQGVQPSRAWSPYGYHIPTSQEVMRGEYLLEELGLYIPVPDQSATLLSIYSQYAAGTSLRSLATSLTERGIAAPRGGLWTASSLGRLLREPLYRGVASWRGIDIPAPAIVPDSLWYEVQERLEAGKWQGGPRLRRYLFSGLVFCPQCGKRMAAAKNGRYVYYRCTPSRDTGCTPGFIVSQPKLIEAVRCVLSDLPNLRGLVEVAQAAYANVQREEALPTEGERSRLESELSELEKRRGAAIQAQIGAIARGGDAEAYTSAVVELERQIGPLRARLESLSRPKGSSGASRSFVAFLERLPLLTERLLTDDTIPASERGKALSILFDRLIPTEDGLIFEIASGESVLRLRTHGTDSIDVEVVSGGVGAFAEGGT
jgi:site-specific DNA recombinase